MISQYYNDISKAMSLVNLVPKVNHGGCGWVALNLYDRLKELGIKDVSIIEVKYRDIFSPPAKYMYNPKYNSKLNNIDNEGSCTHAVVRVYDEGREWFIDSTGIYCGRYDLMSRTKYIPTSVYVFGNKYCFRDIVLHGTDWNWEFNPKYKPDIKEIIDSIGSSVYNESSLVAKLRNYLGV